MSKEKEIIRLSHQGFSQRSICKMLRTSDRKIKQIKDKLDKLNLTYDDVKDMDDETFLDLITERKEVKFTQRRPDCKHVHEELKRKNVTLMLLWEEYVEEAQLLNESYLKYTQFCNVYKEYVESNKLTMHINRKPGEKCEVDWAGSTQPLYDKSLQNIIGKAYIFIGVLPFSQYMFAQASIDMKEEAWINHHIDMFNYYGGVPLICVCDNCKTAVISHKKYEEIIYNKTYSEMAEYYGTAVMAARVRAPRDKNSAESSVGYASRQILGRLRDVKFNTIMELNERIRAELKKLNDKEFQKREYSRSYVLENEEKEYLSPLPIMPYEYAIWSTATVNYNYHIQFERNYYSVPYQYLNKEVNVRTTRQLVEIYYNNIRIASHPRVTIGRNVYKTIDNHMPDNHKAYGEWNSERIKNWAKTIGPSTYQVISNIFMNARIEQQVYNQCITIIKLKDKYSVKLLEAAAKLILEKHITPIHRNFKIAIENMQENKENEKKENNYALVRGASYYKDNRND